MANLASPVSKTVIQIRGTQDHKLFLVSDEEIIKKVLSFYLSVNMSSIL